MSQSELEIPCHALRIENLSLRVRLGCTAHERAKPQEVRVSAEFRFREPPRGILTDSLADTICYAEISDALRAHAESGEFNLIERLAVECFSILKKVADGRATVGLSLHKVRPPVENLLGGSHYRCGDFFL